MPPPVRLATLNGAHGLWTLSTSFQRVRDAPPGGVLCACLRSCFSCRLSVNELWPLPGTVMAFATAAMAVRVSSPRGGVMSRMLLTWCCGRSLRGPQLSACSPPGVCAEGGCYPIVVRCRSVLAQDDLSVPKRASSGHHVVQPPWLHQCVVGVVAR